MLWTHAEFEAPKVNSREVAMSACNMNAVLEGLAVSTQKEMRSPWE